jgi:hypothetical protein
MRTRRRDGWDRPGGIGPRPQGDPQELGSIAAELPVMVVSDSVEPDFDPARWQTPPPVVVPDGADGAVISSWAALPVVAPAELPQ